MWMSTSISFTASCQRRPRSSRTTARYVSLFRVCIVFILSFYFHTLCLIFVYPTLAVLMGEDNTAFEGLFGFCSISPGGSIGLSNVRVLSVFGFIAFMLSPYILPPAAADVTIDWVGSLQLTSGSATSTTSCSGSWSSCGRPRTCYTLMLAHWRGLRGTDGVMACSFYKFGEYFPGTGMQEVKSIIRSASRSRAGSWTRGASM